MRSSTSTAATWSSRLTTDGGGSAGAAARTSARSNGARASALAGDVWIRNVSAGALGD
jgi:hypothetical protein